MRDFAKPKGRLRALSFHARLAYSGFLAFTLAGFALTAWLVEDMVGLRLERASEYYAGEAAEAPELDDAPVMAGGPVLDLPEEGVALAPAGALSQRKLLEVTHFHLFTMPVYLLILCHLFMLSRLGPGLKTSVIGTATAGTALHVAAPWAATSGSAASIAFYGVSGSMMAVSYLLMCAIPLWEMWAPAPRTSAADQSDTVTPHASSVAG
jgi:hypothetical protein